ncbi:MAG: ribonuclease P protein component, partial [Candidatus Limnocylindria bacterium]
MDAARLRRSKDIALVRAEGLLRTDRHFTMRSRRNGGDAVRIAFSTPRSIGSSVRRNRVRRRLREAMRVALATRGRAPGTDLLIV